MIASSVIAPFRLCAFQFRRSTQNACGPVQGIEAEAQRQMPVVDATVDRVGEARAGVRNTAKQTYNYRTGR